MKIILLTLALTLTASAVSAQTPGLPTGEPVVAPTPKLSETLAKNFTDKTTVSKERREQALAKLLEGQRYLWLRQHSQRLRKQAEIPVYVRQAKQAFQKAVELDPSLAEGYTALAELAIIAPPSDVDEAIILAGIAVKLNPDNFGGQKILARLYTLKSNIGRNNMNAEFTDKAVKQWKEVARLDPRYAEAWAFLGAFYELQNKSEDRIDALNRWLSSATPLETGFYQNILGNQEQLTAESATVKLGSALLDAGRSKEAVEILSRAIADDPQNPEAIELLSVAVDSPDFENANVAVVALQQAVFANPENVVLVNLLSQTQANAGQIDDAAKTLRDNIIKIEPTNKNAAAALQIKLGDILSEAGRDDEAITVYQNALRSRVIGKSELITDPERDFAINVYEKIIGVYKKTNRTTEAKTFIENSRAVFGKSDLFADRQIIELYRESGKKTEALQAVRALRAKSPDDYSLLRIEASVLTETGKVDEAVKLIQPLIGKTSQIPSIMNDDFVNYLFISGLYNQAKRGKEAIEAANQAFAITKDKQRKEIALLTLATAQQNSGDVKAAETTLREVLAQSPGNPIALNNLGYFLLERNEKINEAFDLIKKAVKIDPTNPSYLDSLGWAYFKMGNLAEAEKSLKQAAKYDSASATIQEHLGDVYQKQGKPALAKAAWQKALTITTDVEDTNRIKSKLSR